MRTTTAGRLSLRFNVSSRTAATRRAICTAMAARVRASQRSSLTRRCRCRNGFHTERGPDKVRAAMTNVLGVIPARGGSKGVPNKNPALLGGRPLLAYTADAAKASTKLTRTIVSTDDQRIAECAKSLDLGVLMR